MSSDSLAEALHVAEAVLASDWLAAHDAQVRAAERQKVAALLADEGTVEKVAEAVWAESASPGAAPTDAHRDISRAALDALAGLIGGEDRGSELLLVDLDCPKCREPLHGGEC